MWSTITTCISLLRSTSWFTYLLSSLVSTISTWQTLPGPYFLNDPYVLSWLSQFSSQTEVQKHCVSDPNWSGLRGKKGRNTLSSFGVLCPNLMSCKHLLAVCNSLLWVWRRLIKYMGKICCSVGGTKWIFTFTDVSSQRGEFHLWTTTLGSSYPAEATELTELRECSVLFGSSTVTSNEKLHANLQQSVLTGELHKLFRKKRTASIHSF